MILPLLLALQVTPVQPLARATPLPPPDAETAAVLAPIERMLAGLAAKDAARVLAQTRPEGRGTLVEAGGVRAMSWADFVARLPGDRRRIEERLINPAVEIDGDVAMVWSPYVLLVDGRTSHCGANHFSMVRDAGGWKILHLTWTQRTDDCPAPPKGDR